MMICGMHFMALVRDLVKCSVSRGTVLIMLFFTWRMFEVAGTKHSDILKTPTILLITGIHVLTMKLFMFCVANGWIDCRDSFHAVLHL